MEGKIYIGEYESPDGRLGERAAIGLGLALAKKGFTVGRLKTGTPMRILRRSFDSSLTEEQEADEIMRPFSFSNAEIHRPYAKCYITHTNRETHNIIRENLHRAALFRAKSQEREPATAPPSKIRLKIPRTGPPPCLHRTGRLKHGRALYKRAFFLPSRRCAGQNDKNYSLL